MLPEWFVYIGVGLSFIGGLVYFVDTLKGRSQPNRVTFFFWAAVPLVSFVAELQEGVGAQALLTFIVGFNPLMIFLASFANKKAYWKIDRFDIFCGIFASLGIILWITTKDANLAIIFGVLADFAASLPTLKKAYQDPASETAITYQFATVNGLIVALTITDWTHLATVLWPVYILAINLLLTLILIRPKNKK